MRDVNARGWWVTSQLDPRRPLHFTDETGELLELEHSLIRTLDVQLKLALTPSCSHFCRLW